MAAIATISVLGSAWAADAVGPQERSRGDPAVYGLLARQGVEPAFVLAHGTTLTKICDIRFANRRLSYSLYWLEHETQAAQVVHGRAELIAISHSGDVFGTYDSDMSEKPRCIGHNTMVRMVDPGRHATSFSPGRLPSWLGGGSGFFYAVARYQGASIVDGVVLPPPLDPR